MITRAPCRARTWDVAFRAAKPKVAIIAMLAIGATQTGCSSQDSTSDHATPSLADRGWVTNCTGPLFTRASQNSSALERGPSPVFKLTDQLVLAIPTSNSPQASSTSAEPSKCRDASDLPPVLFVTFVIAGKWSAGYKPEDIQTLNGVPQFQPDVIGVRIERAQPSGWTAAEEQKFLVDRAEGWRRESTGIKQFGDLSCFVPEPAAIYFNCTGHRSKGDPDTVSLRFRDDVPGTRFKLLQAVYISSRYKGIQVYWQGWILDVSDALEVDAAVWNAIEEWNLVNNADSQAERQ